MKLQYYLAGSLIVLALAACSPPQPEAGPTSLPSATAQPTATPNPTSTHTPSATPIPISAVCSPLAGHAIDTLLSLYLTQPFIPPAGANEETGHHGLDFAYYSGGPSGGHINGTPVQSVLDAQVAGLGYNGVYGHYLITETRFTHLPAELAAHYQAGEQDSLYVLYAHLQQPAPFELGDALACAQMLGHVGDSGDRFFVSDPHLHLETRVGAAGLRLGPMAYYSTTATEEEKAEYLRWRTGEELHLMDPTFLLNSAR